MLYQCLIAPFYDFSFMRNALLGLAVVSLSCAPVGVFLMLRRMSLTGDAMAHAMLPGAALGFLLAGMSLPALTLGSLTAGILVAVASGLVARFTQIKEDASLAAFYLLSLALGVILMSIKGSNVDLLHVLFGNVLGLDREALFWLLSIGTLSLLILAVIFRPLVMECVDPQFLRSVSSLGTLIHITFLCLVVLNLVGGFLALGTLLAVGIMMLPAASARCWTQDMTGLLVGAVLIALFSGFIGLLLSFHFGLPSGPSIIVSCGIIYIFSIVFGTNGGVIRFLFTQRGNGL